MNVRVSAGRGARSVAVALFVAAYPFAVATGLDHASARTIGALLLALTVAAAALAGDRTSRLLPLLLKRFGVVAALAFAAAATDHPVALTLLPTITSLWLLATFGATLRQGQSLIEQFAQTQHDGFPDFLAPYCRKVTWGWCVFFALNAATSAALAMFASAHAWAVYTGLLSYVIIGVFAALEYLLHKFLFRFYGNGPIDSLWRRACPPDATALGRRTLNWQIARGLVGADGRSHGSRG